MTELRQNTSNAVRILILLLLSLAGIIITGISTIILSTLNISIMWSIVLQDILVFILPAILLASICYKHPWRFLQLNHAPQWQAIVLVAMIWVASLPALNWIVEWNQNLHLPAGLAAWDRLMHEAEEQAEQMMSQILTTDTVGQMLLAFVVVGIMAGVSEELFFRGALMGIMRRGRASVHVVIWVVAIVFSAIHMQFLGFVPRMLLGAWFGYLLLWTRSLWIPIIAHTLNNGMVVVFEWMAHNHWVDKESIDHLGVPTDGSFPLMALMSVMGTTALIVMVYHIFSKKSS